MFCYSDVEIFSAAEQALQGPERCQVITWKINIKAGAFESRIFDVCSAFVGSGSVSFGVSMLLLFQPNQNPRNRKRVGPLQPRRRQLPVRQVCPVTCFCCCSRGRFARWGHQPWMHGWCPQWPHWASSWTTNLSKSSKGERWWLLFSAAPYHHFLSLKEKRDICLCLLKFWMTVKVCSI